MRKPYTSRTEQYKMIMECRQSGLSDCQWCKLKGIHPSTFYNWVTRLRRTGQYDIPDKTNASDYVPTPHQDIVEIVPAELSEKCEHFAPIPQMVMELSVGNLSLKIPNGTNPELLSIAIRAIGGQL